MYRTHQTFTQYFVGVTSEVEDLLSAGYAIGGVACKKKKAFLYHINIKHSDIFFTLLGSWDQNTGSAMIQFLRAEEVKVLALRGQQWQCGRAED